MVMIVVTMLPMLVLAARRRHTHRGFPKFLRWSRKLLHVRQEDCDLPHILIAEYLVPCRHARVADAVANDEVVVRVGIVGWVQDQLWRGRVERLSLWGGLL